jgi:DNA polymerase
MQTVFLDFETFYDTDYSLRRMTPVEYILDPRFETIGVAVAIEGDEPFWLNGEHFDRWCEDNYELLISSKVVSHNALFDMAILSYRYGIVPRLMIDTLGMARARLAYNTNSLSLASLATHFGIGAKGDAIHNVKGMNAVAMRQAGVYEGLVEYAINDVALCRTIYQKMLPFPVHELVIQDMVLRCAVQPIFTLDSYLLAEHLNEVRQSKSELLQRAGLTSRDDLMSNERFAQALRTLGVEPPMKTSLVTGKSTYAFSKTDPAFLELEEHESPDVQALVTARLGLKSTLEESRTEKFLTIANLVWPDGSRALMPIPLRYSGAHTHRLSGDWGINMQNLPRGGKLRKALKAPDGYVVIAADAAQIEARMVAWFAGQQNLVDQFANGEDVYCSFASVVFGRTITKADKKERWIGKTAVLGLGYGMGWMKFQATVKILSKNQLGEQIELGDEEAQRIVNAYRTTYPKIPAMWQTLNNTLSLISSGKGTARLGPVTCGVTAGPGQIDLPSGLSLYYKNLRHEDGQWVFDFGRTKGKRIFGGKLLENIVQALARIVVMDAAVRLRKPLAMHDVRLAGQVHDELIYVVPEDLTTVVKALVLQEMSTAPEWAVGLPLSAEAESGPSYGNAK